MRRLTARRVIEAGWTDDRRKRVELGGSVVYFASVRNAASAEVPLDRLEPAPHHMVGAAPAVVMNHRAARPARTRALDCSVRTHDR